MPGPRRSWIVSNVVVPSIYYLGIALWCVHAVLPAFDSTIARGADVLPQWRQITEADQKLVVAVVNAHARTLLGAPTKLLDGPQCWPLPRALMLGQHELNEGMLAVVPYALSRDPVVTYNLVMILSVLLAGLAMHALVKDWTGDAAAAFVAGTLFAIHPSRVGDLVHLSAIGNYWTVVTLLFLFRLFTRPSWTVAIALGLAAAAQTMESIYPLVPHAIVCGTVGVWLLWRHRRGVDLPKLALAGMGIVGSAIAVLGPYLEFRATWGSLAGRTPLLYSPADFGFGGAAYTGTVALLCALVGLVDRARRRGTTPEPHGALLVAGLVMVWAAVVAVPLPGGGTVPSLFTLLARVLPGFDAVRRGGVVVSGWHLVVVVLAGYGVAAVTRGRSAPLRAALGAAVVALALLEVFAPAVARASFGRTLSLVAYAVRPSDPVRALYAKMADGAVLDVPYELGPGRFFRMADFVLANAWHERPVAACYNSFRVAVQEDQSLYAARVLTDPRAADALAALGVRNVLYHIGLPSRMPLPPPGAVGSHLTEIGRAGSQVLYRLPDPPPTTEAPDAIDVGVEAGGPAATALVFRNRGALLYRHPAPIAPTPFVLRWYDAGDRVLAEQQVAVLLPTALPAGEELRRPLPATAARPAGAARVSVSSADGTRPPATVPLR